MVEPQTPDAQGAEAEGELNADEIKAKFREALDKKHEQPAHDSSSAGPGGPKVNSAQGPAGHKREFRRKSG